MSDYLEGNNVRVLSSELRLSQTASFIVAVSQSSTKTEQLVRAKNFCSFVRPREKNCGAEIALNSGKVGVDFAFWLLLMVMVILCTQTEATHLPKAAGAFTHFYTPLLEER